MAIEAILTMSAAVIKVIWEYLEKYAKEYNMPAEELRQKALELAKDYDKSAVELLKTIKKTEGE